MESEPPTGRGCIEWISSDQKEWVLPEGNGHSGTNRDEVLRVSTA